jgi:hypothetical protein
MLTLPVPVQTEQLTHRQQWLLLSIALSGSIVIHSPTLLLHSLLPNLFQQLSPAHIAVMNSFRGFFFLIISALLLILIVKPCMRFIIRQKNTIPFGLILGRAIVVMFVMSILIIPSKLGIMGVGYAAFSIEPFSSTDSSLQIYQRLMMPALAYFLQFKDAVMYHIFSLLITGLCIFGIQLYFAVRAISLSLLEIVSISSACFIATQFQSPGYPESLVILSALVVITIPLNSSSRIALSLFALFVHEASALLFGMIALLFFTKEERKVYFVAVFLYALCWVTSFGFDFKRLTEVRNVGGMSGVEWLVSHPFREVLGIVISYKALWVFLFVVVIRFPLHVKSVSMLFLPGIILTVMAVDTTRLMAFGFLPFLFALDYVRRYALLSRHQIRTLHIVNVIIPSVYVGLNSGIVLFDGLYQLLYQGVFLK